MGGDANSLVGFYHNATDNSGFASYSFYLLLQVKAAEAVKLS
jgi:hypothetical protein